MDLINESIEVLNDAKLYLTKLTDEEYSQEIELMSNSTIGQHTRHFIEFFLCLLSQVNKQEINYCLRERDLNIQQRPETAIKTIDDIILRLDDLNLASQVQFFPAKDATTSITSTVARELSYNIEHCIHHLALIKIGLKILKPEMELPSSFGVAASTIRHRNTLSS